MDVYLTCKQCEKEIDTPEETENHVCDTELNKEKLQTDIDKLWIDAFHCSKHKQDYDNIMNRLGIKY